MSAPTQSNQKFESFSPKYVQITICSLIVIFCLPLLTALTLSTLIYRVFISLLLKINSNNTLSLVSPSDAVFAVEKYANTSTVNTLMYIKGSADIQKIRNKFSKTLISRDEKTGHQKFLKLMFRLTSKFGLYCWEDQRDTFDICNHVKFCPKADSPHITYSEREVLEVMEKLADIPLSESSKPQWEMLIVPQVKINCDQGGKSGESPSYHAIISRYYHPYMDGISMMQLFHKGICDSPGIFIQDPINPTNIPKLSILHTFAHYLQIFFIGPHTIYESTRGDPTSVFQGMRENKGPKFLGYTKRNMKIESVKKIRKAFNCSTTSVFNSGFVGALGKAAERKGLPLPASETIDFGFTVAVVPYPNDEPQNRFTIATMKSSMWPAKDPVERLKINSNIVKALRAHEVSTFYWFGRLVGLFPVPMMELILSNMRISYVFTNLPGFSNKLKLNGNTVEEMFGCPPIKNGIGYSIGISSYIDNFRVCCLAEKSRVISCREDMDNLMADLENELKCLELLAVERIK